MGYTEKSHASACNVFFGKICNCAVGEVEQLQRRLSAALELVQGWKELSDENVRLRVELTCLRLWYDEVRMPITAEDAVGGDTLPSAPDALELFRLHPELAPPNHRGTPT